MSSLPKTGDSFIDQYAPDAIQSQKQTGVPASFTLAQALIESGRGKSALTLQALNFFGIKGEGPAGHVVLNTREENAAGQSFFIDAKFAKYNTAAECFVVHGQIFLKPRYAPAMAVKNDARAFARQVQACGYATAHNYADTLISVINKFDLTRLDKLAGSQTTTTAPQTTARPILELDSSGQAVRDLQNALVKLGFLAASEVDGEFGEITEAAVEAFQKSKNLTADGVCGADTWKALKV
ncbi:MAG TPA: glucosaminidase domain-containing protein [Pyrinomonadaceae bacterium]|jgi:flagellum-specific peptidoglycan hydrolase FlgJ